MGQIGIDGAPRKDLIADNDQAGRHRFAAHVALQTVHISHVAPKLSQVGVSDHGKSTPQAAPAKAVTASGSYPPACIVAGVLVR